MLKDKYGYEIVDKTNKIHYTTDSKSGTWRDDKYEECLYSIIDIIQKTYPDNPKMQGSLIISLPSLMAATILETEIEKHEKGEIPHYLKAGKRIMEIHETLCTATSDALVKQASMLAEYLIQCPKLIEDEKLEELK